jgi:hypothetical protein
MVAETDVMMLVAEVVEVVVQASAQLAVLMLATLTVR